MIPNLSASLTDVYLMKSDVRMSVVGSVAGVKAIVGFHVGQDLVLAVSAELGVVGGVA